MMRKQLRGVTALATLALGLVAGGANAYVPSSEHTALDIPLPFQQGNLVYGDEATSFASPRVGASIAEQIGGRWSVHSWNRQARSAHYVLGSGADVAPPLAGLADAESAARHVLSQNSTALHVNPSQLRLLTVAEGAGKYGVHFQQTYEGLDVLGGRAHATFMNTGRVFVMGADFYRIEDLSILSGLSQAEAEAIAIGDLPHPQRSVSAEVGEETGLYVLPYPTSLDTFEPRLVWKVTVVTDGRTGVFETYLDADTGEILWRHNDVHFVNYTGAIEGNVNDATYCNGETLQSLKYEEVSIAGVGTTNSDGNGDWIIPNGDSTPRTATTRFYGPYVDVNRSSGGADATQSATATPGTPLTFSWTDGNARQDERDVFDGVVDIHDFIEVFDPGFSYSNVRITANVGVSGTCNAFWNGSINFYNAGGGCANTGEIQGVVHHEFGHGIQATMLGSQGNEGLGEGNADIIANFMTDESIIGRGFYAGNCTGGIRNCDNNFQYPENLTGQVHNDGQIICGVMWDVRENLEASLGAAAGELHAARIWHFGRKIERPFNQPDQVLSMFITDDDNGNLDDGTPNYDALCSAVTAHDTDGDGFECPPILVGVFVVHTAVTTPQPEGDTVLMAVATTTILGAFVVPGSVQVHYSINGAPVTDTVMAPTGNPNEYTTTLAGLTEPSEVAYYITAADNLGNTGSSPREAPLEQHLFDIPTVWDDIETDTGWTVNTEGTDDATTGVWVRVDPVPTEAQPDNDHTPAPGVLCWITGQHPGGGIGENDVDGGSTTLYSPVYDLSEATSAKVKYYRWYSNMHGNAPGADTWVVQARNNGGTWVDIERNQSDQDTWFLVSAELVPLLGPLGNVQFKFIASDLADGSIVEGGVDDFELLVHGSSTDVPGTAATTSRFAFYGARPNPVQGASTIAFQVPATTRVELALYDVAGRMVRSLANGSFEAGQHQIDWDGRDAQGHEVGSGVYFVRMNAAEFHATRSFVVTR